MTIIEHAEEIGRRSGGQTRVLVPTMGALHHGHERLIRHGRNLAGKAGQLIVSIFVNPTQFGPDEDFETYPRTPAKDHSLCITAGTDILFQPTVEEIYGTGQDLGTNADTKLTGTLCGSDRPGHFDGVCTVVQQLFSLIEPDIAVFGKKDYQQLAVIKQMTTNLKMPVKIIGSETIREKDGLAMSSRNRYLSAQQRAQAPVLYKALKGIRENKNPESAARIKAAREMIAREAPLGKISYLQIVDRETMQDLIEIDRPALAATAVHFGAARLIDNIEIDPVI